MKTRRRKLEIQQDKRISRVHCHDIVIKLVVEQKSQGQLKICVQYGGIIVDSFLFSKSEKMLPHMQNRGSNLRVNNYVTFINKTDEVTIVI